MIITAERDFVSRKFTGRMRVERPNGELVGFATSYRMAQEIAAAAAARHDR